MNSTIFRKLIWTAVFAISIAKPFNLSAQDDDSFTLFIEAEDGAEYNPIIVKSDTSASQEIYLASWQNVDYWQPPQNGRVDYTFTVDKTTSVKFMARVITIDHSSNSFWIKIDNNSWGAWDNISTSDKWQWRAYDQTLTFGPGEHTISLAIREKGTKIDKVLITDDHSLVPEGKGEPKPTLPGTVSYKSGIVGLNGNLQLINNTICNEQGVPVQLRGISTHGFQWFPIYKDHTIPNAVKFFNIDIIRIAMYVEDYKFINNEMDFWNGYMADKDSTLKKKEDYIQDAIDAGVYVIIDWHIHNVPSNFTSDAIEFFSKMSKKYGGYPNVLFEICNEPEGGVSWSSIKSYAEQVIPVIRNNDPDDHENIIIVGTPNWCQYVDEAANDPILNYDNLVYALHFYAASHKESYRQRALDALNGTNNMGNNYNRNKIPLIATEWGTSDYSTTVTDFNEAQKWLDLLDSQNISWINWSLSNKDEASSILKPTSGLSGPWTYEDLTVSGAWIKEKLPQDPIVTSVSNDLKNNSIKVKNYPNPFSGSTNIVVEGYTGANVELTIFTSSGKMVAKDSKKLLTSPTNFIWDGEDTTGEKLPAGIYYGQVKTENNTEYFTLVIH